MMTFEQIASYRYSARSATPIDQDYRYRWVLSETTIREIAAASGIPIDDDEPIPQPAQLMGYPIRIDDSVPGLSHELI